MRRQRSRQQRKRPYLLLCCLLAAVFIGHDALMTVAIAAPPSDSHTSTYEAYEYEVQDRRRLPPELEPRSAPPVLDSPGARHPKDCDMGWGAFIHRDAEIECLDQFLVERVNIMHGEPLAGHRAATSVATAAPEWPAGTRRALLQVYRI